MDTKSSTHGGNKSIRGEQLHGRCDALCLVLNE